MQKGEKKTSTSLRLFEVKVVYFKKEQIQLQNNTTVWLIE